MQGYCAHSLTRFSVFGLPNLPSARFVNAVLRRAYSKEADIWSCGVILYILLCGFPPFSGTNEKAIFRNVMSQVWVWTCIMCEGKLPLQTVFHLRSLIKPCVRSLI